MVEGKDFVGAVFRQKLVVNTLVMLDRFSSASLAKTGPALTSGISNKIFFGRELICRFATRPTNENIF